MEEKVMNMTIWGSIRAIMCDEEVLWKPYLEKMLHLREDIRAGKIPYAEFQGKNSAILKRASDASTGVDFDYPTMFQVSVF